MIFRSVRSLFITYTLILVAGIAIPLTYSGYVLMEDIIYQSGTETLKDKLESLIQPVSQRYARLQRIGLEDSKTHMTEIHTRALEQFSNYLYKNSGTIFVLSNDDRMIISRDFLKDELISDPNITTAINTHSEGVIEYSVNGTEKLAVYRHYEPWNETIALSITKNELFAARDMFLRIILFVLIIILTLATVALVLLLKRIVQPLVQLANCADELSEGNFDKETAGNYWGEFSTLQHAFDTMRVNIKEKVSRIEGQLKIIQLKENTLTEAITELEQSEALLRTLIEALPDLVWLKDPNGVYLACNPRFERFFGAKEDEILGKTDYDFIDKAQANFFREHDLKAMNAGVPTQNEEEVSYADDGHKELLETVKTPMYSPDGSVIGILGVGRDITERRQAEIDLRRAQKMDAVGQLTGGIAHDFNNILAIILGNLELLKHQVKSDEKAYQRADSIQKAAERAAKLTKQLLGFSRRKAAQLVTTNINSVIKDMGSLISRSVTPEVEVEQHFSDDLWLTEIDPGDFEDALLNLAINARDAMSGRGHLTIETHNVILDDTYCAQNTDVIPGEYVQLAISDNGEGIPLEQQERIFEPFYSTKPVGKGTGLGLAMVFGFSNRSGGHIKVYSEQGVGTTFRLYLPRTAGEIEHVEQYGQETELMPHGSETVLVVDDEPYLVEIAKDLLEGLGYRVLTASDGRQALEVLAGEENIDLLFSDVVMPGGLNGYELAEQATATYPTLQVLLTSGYTEKAVSHNDHDHFDSNLLSKPYTQADLAKGIRTILSGETVN